LTEFLDKVAQVAILVFVVTSMATAGLSLRARELAQPLRRARLVLLAILANFVVVPLAAYGLTELIPLHRPYAIGLLLLGGAAGAPFLPKLVEVAKGDLALSVALMLLLTIGTIVFMPLVLPLLIPGMAADPWPILRPLLFSMLIPIAVGMAVKARSERWAQRLHPGFKLVSNITMLLAVVLLISLNFSAMVGTFGTGAIALALLFVALAIGTGYLLGGPSRETRAVLGLGTGQRNIAAALVIATQNFSSDPGVAVMLLVTTFTGLAVLLIAARRLAPKDVGAIPESRPAAPEPLAVEANQ
jgi:BASS family bile acid:Na+ symporter